ncbi:MAG: CHASE2 domain-containing protein, partial [Burkholderiales bacterium]|nr:CHASE2 domain-containing protein [Burkholderiales bacterium]
MSQAPSSNRPLAPARSRRSGGPETAAQRAVRWLLLALALALAVAMELRQAQLPLAREIDANLRDAAMRLSASDQGDPRLAVVDIDEASLRQLGPWPWPRARLAELAERLLSDAGATLVVFDLVLTEGERSAGGSAGVGAGAGPGGAAGTAAGDDRLIAMAQARRLVAAQAFDYLRRDDATPTATGTVGGAIGRAAPGGADPATSATSATPATQATTGAQATGYIGNFSALARSPCIGNIGFVPDRDGRIRRIAPVTDWAGGRF